MAFGKLNVDENPSECSECSNGDDRAEGEDGGRDLFVCWPGVVTGVLVVVFESDSLVTSDIGSVVTEANPEEV